MTPELHRPWFSHYEPSVPRTVTVFDQPLYSLLDEAAARYPKRPALIFQNTRLSYKALHEAAERFAGALRRAGIRPGQRVAVMLAQPAPDHDRLLGRGQMRGRGRDGQPPLHGTGAAPEPQ